MAKLTILIDNSLLGLIRFIYQRKLTCGIKVNFCVCGLIKLENVAPIMGGRDQQFNVMKPLQSKMFTHTLYPHKFSQQKLIIKIKGNKVGMSFAKLSSSLC